MIVSSMMVVQFVVGRPLTATEMQIKNMTKPQLRLGTQDCHCSVGCSFTAAGHQKCNTILSLSLVSSSICLDSVLGVQRRCGGVDDRCKCAKSYAF